MFSSLEWVPLSYEKEKQTHISPKCSQVQKLMSTILALEWVRQKDWH